MSEQTKFTPGPNACLAEAAPELYGAAEFAETTLVALLEIKGVATHPAIDALRAALSKARGTPMTAPTQRNSDEGANPMSVEGLLPCPFCGAGASVEEVNTGLGHGGVSFSVGCDSPDEAACMGYHRALRGHEDNHGREL